MSKRHGYTSAEIQIRHSRLVLDFRSQDRLIQSESFSEAWDCASDVDRKIILEIFDRPNTAALRSWMLKMLRDGLDEYPFVELRKIASRYKIAKYSRMSREQLLEVLTTKGIPDGSTNVK